MSNKLSHTDSEGNARMVDVGHKPDQIRIARAEGRILLKPETLKVYFDTLFKKMSDHLKEEVDWKIENYIEYVQNNQPPR